MGESPELVSRSGRTQRLEQRPLGAPPLDVLKLHLESTQCRDGVPPIGLELRNESTARFRDRLPEASQLGIPGARLSRVEPECRVALLQCAAVAHPQIDEPRFIDLWMRYRRALKQRNTALRLDPAQASAWDPELARLGEAIAESRRRFVTQLQPDWRDTVAALSGLEVELQYVQGWSSEGTLLEALRTTRAQDELRRLTHAGPHRGDVALRLHGRPAREVLSRGQQKLVAIAMTISQLRLLRDLTGTVPTLLLDDPAAELDGERLERFIEQVARLRCQLVVTSLHAESRLFGTPERTFRMEDGRVQSV